MRLAALIASCAGSLVLVSAAGAAAQGAGNEPRAGWYAAGGIGAVWASNMAQSGWNRDPLCYPTDACFDADPRPEVSGYRWHYDVAAAGGAAFEVAAGLFAGRSRVEVSYGQRWNDLDQMFLGVTDYDGAAMADRVGTTVTADTQSSIDQLAVRMLTVNAYYDIPAGSAFSPYVGAGVGPAFVTVAGVRFSDMYRDTAANGDVYDPPLASYNSQPGRRPVRHGAGRPRARRGRLPRGRPDLAGAEAHLVAAGRHRGQRRVRPARRPTRWYPNFEHHDTFAGARSWLLMLTARYVFDN